jgi:hypothetical protein
MMEAALIDWDKIRKNKWANDPSPPEWPTGVRPISLDGTALIGIGPDHRLYWDGQLVAISRKITLNGYQTLLATVTATGAFLGGLAALLRIFGLSQ